ncbi:nitrogen assimilation transcription factor nirA [Cordyceps militaris CM01]|uniref:Nitrogen assimilation transcription factor nirA n=1 Tax=Cordyceps militaris (strain CM01) TaxID=983644 RepID=G3J884_CORMM|nr:nitrogen assimilation transcription factor nirA [Cordyceps militaris CM01]EGX94723.1 nitrogen assimilation transcription factor nirA [Cordyceps militaris CM01]
METAVVPHFGEPMLWPSAHLCEATNSHHIQTLLRLPSVPYPDYSDRLHAAIMQATPEPSYAQQRDTSTAGDPGPALKKKKPSRRATDSSNQKRKCISTACVACRRRKSKCDGAVPSCAACASVYGTECIYDPNSDHRRKGVYREKTDGMKADDVTLKILIEAILNASEDDIDDVVRRIRHCDSLDNLAQQILQDGPSLGGSSAEHSSDEQWVAQVDGERDLAGKMGELRIENGAIRFIGGTSHLIYLGGTSPGHDSEPNAESYLPSMNPITSWTDVTGHVSLITHLLNMYFTYHYPYFTTLSRKLFWRDFSKGRGAVGQSSSHCSSLLVNAMLALGCHFSDLAGACSTLGDTRTKGDHFFAEAKRLIMEEDEFERPRLVTVQALALMSVREAGCAREATGWVYSGMSFRMAQDIGLNLDISYSDRNFMTDEEIDARRITFWGCFNVDKCWSNYLGRLPQLPKSTFTVAKFDVFPDEDASPWIPLTDKGFDESSKQPSRTRAVALQLSSLCEISSDLLLFFYHPNHIHRSTGKTAELKKLSELHKRLEEWRKNLPKEFEPGDGQLPNVILMQPFLKYSPSSSPLPSHISPRRICTSNAGAISKLMRLYKKNWNLRQICNIAVYMTHSACTIHLLNLPEKTAKRDLTHGVKHLEEISEDWLCARRTLRILSVLARKWNCALPEEAAQILQRTDELYGHYSTSEVPSPKSSAGLSPQAPIDETAAVQSHMQPSHVNQHPSPGRVQFAQSAMSQAAGPQASISARLGMNNGPITPQQRHGQPQRDVGVETQHIPYAPGTMDSWGQPIMASSPAAGVYPTSSSAAGLGSNAEAIREFAGSRIAGSGGLTGQGAGLDNNQWILSDSAKWQHNFNGWELGQPLPGAMQFAFPSQGPLPLGTNHAAAAAAAAAAASMQTMGHPPSNLETFDASMHDTRWLPNLE